MTPPAAPKSIFSPDVSSRGAFAKRVAQADTRQFGLLGARESATELDGLKALAARAPKKPAVPPHAPRPPSPPTAIDLQERQRAGSTYGLRLAGSALYAARLVRAVQLAPEASARVWSIAIFDQLKSDIALVAGCLFFGVLYGALMGVVGFGLYRAYEEMRPAVRAATLTPRDLAQQPELFDMLRAPS